MTYRYTQPQHVSAWNHDLPSHVTYDTSLVHKYLVPWQTAWVYALCDARAGMEPWSTQRPRESKWAAWQWLQSTPFLPSVLSNGRGVVPPEEWMDAEGKSEKTKIIPGTGDSVSRFRRYHCSTVINYNSCFPVGEQFWRGVVGLKIQPGGFIEPSRIRKNFP